MGLACCPTNVELAVENVTEYLMDPQRLRIRTGEELRKAFRLGRYVIVHLNQGKHLFAAHCEIFH